MSTTNRQAAAEIMRQLRSRLGQLERSVSPDARSLISSGCQPLDRLLPGGGFTSGSLVEWLAGLPGGAATCFALTAARSALQGVSWARDTSRCSGVLAVVDRQRVFYPPAAAAWGIDLRQLILIHPGNDADELWAMDQILRCRQVAVLLAWPKRLDSFTFRRLQLAAEAGGGLGLLVRGAAARAEPSWADFRILVCPSGKSSGKSSGNRAELASSSSSSSSSSSYRAGAPTGWRLRLEILRCRGHLAAGPTPGRQASGQTSGQTSGQIELEIDSQTGAIYETHLGNPTTELACPASDQRSARA